MYKQAGPRIRTRNRGGTFPTELKVYICFELLYSSTHPEVSQTNLMGTSDIHLEENFSGLLEEMLKLFFEGLLPAVNLETQLFLLVLLLNRISSEELGGVSEEQLSGEQ
ncbi:hypothetical protein ATANTOWER_017193 [Ataeniobius toweri]|uniref:Uncharacterized protein n=1 Tax=Ataeniobius toweri TaxID=208326 RepID=A0ABU7BS44_9TELE|nr:hypothetical protein [Ataeniobius toweri]